MTRNRREDRELWEKVKRTVTPLRQKKTEEDFGRIFHDLGHLDQKAYQPPTRVRPDFRKREPILKPVIAKSAKPPREIEPGLKRRIERGRVEIDDRIDLHGLNQMEAHYRLLSFLDRTNMQGCKTVLVITGKGIGGEGILKNAVPIWLEGDDLRKFVSGYSIAHVSHGGSGALYVRLRSSKKGARQ